LVLLIAALPRLISRLLVIEGTIDALTDPALERARVGLIGIDVPT
jgi:hypothetical protein